MRHEAGGRVKPCRQMGQRDVSEMAKQYVFTERKNNTILPQAQAQRSKRRRRGRIRRKDAFGGEVQRLHRESVPETKCQNKTTKTHKTNKEKTESIQTPTCQLLIATLDTARSLYIPPREGDPSARPLRTMLTVRGRR